MYRANQAHLQAPLFSDLDLLSDKARRILEESWAGVFYREVFCRLREEPFAVLYSDQASRPNVPINVMLSLEALKAGFGWSDEEMHHAFLFDVQVRYAVGLRDLGAGDFDLRTVYNFRQRLSEHMQQTGENLIEAAFEQVTDAQLAAFHLKTGRLRMDSTQIASNIRQMSALQLLVEMLQRVYRILSETEQAHYAAVFAPYLKGSSGHYVYYLRDADWRPHFQRIGELMYQLLDELAAHYQSHASYQLLQRVFHEQFVLSELASPAPDADPGPVSLPTAAATADGRPRPPQLARTAPLTDPTTSSNSSASLVVRARPCQEIGADRLRSPDDPEASYRTKGGQHYEGYVVNLTETCDAANPFQLIVKLQVAPNTTQDASLLAAALPALKARTGVHTLYTDGGYTGPSVDALLRQRQVEQIPSALPGRKAQAHFTALADCVFTLDGDGQPLELTCPHGYRASVTPGQKPGRYRARWAAAPCPVCRFSKNLRHGTGEANPSLCLRFGRIELDCALRRQRCRAQQQGKYNLRAAIEASIGALKRPFSDDQAPVRGRLRLGQMLVGSAFMVNLRRIQRYYWAKTRPNQCIPRGSPGPDRPSQAGDRPGYAPFLMLWSRIPRWLWPLRPGRATWIFGS